MFYIDQVKIKIKEIEKRNNYTGKLLQNMDVKEKQNLQV